MLLKTGSMLALPEADWRRRCLPADQPEQQFRIAETFYYGNGVAQDFARAYNWYRKSADQGFAEAQFSLGIMYENGRGVDRNDMKAASWYRQAAEHGHAGALNNLGCMLHDGRIAGGDSATCASCFHIAAEKGLPAAQYNLSVMYLFGMNVEKDPDEAFKWCGLAADQGYLPACYRLSFMLEHGIGVAKDGDLARKWFSMALQSSPSCTAAWQDTCVRKAPGNRSPFEELPGTMRKKWKTIFKKTRKVDVQSGILTNEYCTDCLLCCGPQPEGDGAFPMKLLDRQIRGNEEDVFYMLDRQTAILDHRGCKALGESGCVLPRQSRPVACNIFPFVLINRRLFLYSPCPLSGLLSMREIKKLAEKVRVWLEVQPEPDIRGLSLYAGPSKLKKKYIDLNMPVCGRSD